MKSFCVSTVLSRYYPLFCVILSRTAAFRNISLNRFPYGSLDKGIHRLTGDCGVPGMIYRTDDGEIHSWLYVLVDEFSSYHAGEEALRDNQQIDYSRISGDLFIK